MRYQKIEVNTWNDEKFTKLSEDGKIMFLYLLTCPHSNSIGAYVVKKGYICDDLKWNQARVTKAVSELLRNGLINYDQTLSVVVVKNYLKHNTIENPNQCKNAVKNFQSLPKTPILQPVINSLETVSKHFKIPFETVEVTVSKPETETVTVTDTDKYLKPPQVVKHQRNIIPPEKEWVEKYCSERNNGIDAQSFIDHYTNTKWRVGKPPGYPMTDWEASVRTWEKRNNKDSLPKQDIEDYVGQEYKKITLAKQ